MKDSNTDVIFLYHAHNHSRVSVIERAINLIKREVKKVESSDINELITQIEQVFRNLCQANL